VLQHVPDVLVTSSSTSTAQYGGRSSSPTVDVDLSGVDDEQARLMEEVCIVVDEDDVVIGSASKKTCHLTRNIDAGLLHRAFSVFLFDPDTKKLLLQQRASEKITFPDMWTNTCCSHPLAVSGESGATGLDAAILGAKRAGQRKLDQELGIPARQVPLKQFHFLTRIHYKAPSSGVWGEHEIDYILFTQQKVDLHINPNEVQAVRYVSPEELREMLLDPSLLFTPWFKLICQSYLFTWWEHLDDLTPYVNLKSVERM